jgi:voltage-gated potassium channel
MTRLERWESRTQGPLLVLALLFAVAYALPILRPGASPGLVRAARWTDWVVWTAFACDYLVRMALCDRPRQLIRDQPLSIAAVVLPLLQPLRLLRLVSALILVGQRIRTGAQLRLTTYVVGSVLVLMVFGSLAVLDAERSSRHGNILTFGDALWWSFTTMSTLGYGDHAPTTGMGRLIAVGLMLAGIALLGVVTANIAAWFVAQFQEDGAESRRNQQISEELLREVRELRRQVAHLVAETALLRSDDDTPGRPPADRG